MKESVGKDGFACNLRKTKSMHLLDCKRRVTVKIDHCGVCGERVDFNSIRCFQYKNWFIIVAQMFHTESVLVLYMVSLFVDLVRLVAAEVEVSGYLGDILNSNGGAAEALSDRDGSA